MSGDLDNKGLYTPQGMRKHLVKAYPATFKDKGQIKLPLKIGIHFDIQARAPWLTMEEIKAGLKDYTDGPKYLERCVQGAWRIDLDGRAVSMVTARQQQHSAERLARLRAEWDAKERPPLTLGEILQAALKEKDTPMISTIVSGFLPSARKDRSPLTTDALSFFDTIRTLSNRGTYGARTEAIELIEKRDRTNLEYGAEQAVVAGVARTAPAIHKSMEEVVAHVRQGRKIEAIKSYRALAGVGLKEAKDFVESMQGLPGVAVTPVHTPYGIQPKDYMVLSKSASYGDEYQDEGRYSDVSGAESLAKRVNERSPTSEVLLVKIIGRTKSLFSMVA
jgi:sRNA-binding protein